MKVLNIEDSPFKHYDVSKVVLSCTKAEIDWSTNLRDGLEKIQYALDQWQPYDLIITDMFYPLKPGQRDEEAGKILIQNVMDQGLTTPIILCSTVKYDFPEILGCIHYSDLADWESDLKKLVEKAITQK